MLHPYSDSACVGDGGAASLDFKGHFVEVVRDRTLLAVFCRLDVFDALASSYFLECHSGDYIYRVGRAGHALERVFKIGPD